MKNLRTALLILAALCLTLPAVAQKNRKNAAPGRQIAVRGIAFYNLENLFDTINNNGKYDLEFSPRGARQWNGTKYRSKLSNLARAITAMVTPATPNGPAVIGVSEIENKSVMDDLAAEVDRQLVEKGKRPWHLQVVHHDSPDRRGVDVGLFYNPYQFKFLEVTNRTLDIGYPTRDQMCVKGITLGDTINIIVNHWPSRIGGQEQSSPNREAAAALCKKTAEEIWAANPGQGVIIMGDLNDDPQDKSCAVVLGALPKQDKVEINGFFNPWWSILDKGIGTLAYKGGWNLFDQIIVSGNLLEKYAADKGKIHFRSAKVNNFDFLTGEDGNRQKYPLRTYSAGVFLNGYSDHFPTEIFLQKVKQ